MKKQFLLVMFFIHLLTYPFVVFAADGWTQAENPGSFTTTDSGGIYINAVGTTKWTKSGCSSTQAYISPTTTRNGMFSTLMLAIAQGKKVKFYGNCDTGSGYYFYASRINYVD